MHSLYLAIGALSIRFAIAQQCYYPDGKVPTDFNYVPCVGVKNSSCCIPDEGDICLSNGLCYFPGDQYTYRGACTDPTFKDPACTNYCLGKPPKGNSSTWVTLEACGGTSYCCYEEANDCCSDKSLIFTITDVTQIPSPYPAAASYAPFQSSSSSATPSATSSATTSAITASTSSAASSTSTSTGPPDSSSSPKKIPIAVVVAAAAVVVVAVLIAVGIIVCCIRRKKRRNAVAPAVSNPLPQEPQAEQQHPDNYPMKPYPGPNIYEAPYTPAVYSPPPAYSPHLAELATNPQTQPTSHAGHPIYEMGN